MASDLSIFIDDIRLNVRVGVVLRHGNNVFIECFNDTDYVVIPGGRVKIGEHSAEAMVREAFEEMGIKLNKNKLNFLKCIENFYDYHDHKNHEFYFVYSYELSDFELDEVLKLEKNKDNEKAYFKLISRFDIENYPVLPTTLIELLK